MRRILVGLDDSPAARHALAWSADLAGRGDMELVATRVFVPDQAELLPDRDAARHDGQRRELEEWCASLPAVTSTVLVDGDPPAALLAVARERDVDMLVVGGREAGGFLHLRLGSLAHHLAHHATVPLAIVPSGGAGTLHHLVVGVDGSPGGRRVAELAAELAGRLGIGVTAVHAAEPFAEWVPETDPRSWHKRAEADVRAWAAAIEDAGVPLTVEVERDIHPVAAIGRAVEAHPGATALVGARGASGITGLLADRVPVQLVHNRDAAVIVVPPG